MAVFSKTNFKVLNFLYYPFVLGPFYFTSLVLYLPLTGPKKQPSHPPSHHAHTFGLDGLKPQKISRVHVSIFRLPLEEELKAMEVVWQKKSHIKIKDIMG